MLRSLVSIISSVRMVRYQTPLINPLTMITALISTSLAGVALTGASLSAYLLCCFKTDADELIIESSRPQGGLAMEYLLDRRDLTRAGSGSVMTSCTSVTSESSVIYSTSSSSSDDSGVSLEYGNFPVLTSDALQRLSSSMEAEDGSSSEINSPQEKSPRDENQVSLESVVFPRLTRNALRRLDTDMSVNLREVENSEAESSSRVKNEIFCNMELDNTPVKERRHRRLPHKRASRISYLSIAVSEVKNKIGTPTDNDANRMVARRLLRTTMESHGLRPSHINQLIAIGVELVFIPNDSEVCAAKVKLAREARQRKNRVAGRWTWFGLRWQPSGNASYSAN